MKYFTLYELEYSDTAIKKKIKNIPTPQIENNLIDLIDNVLDPLREKWGKPLTVNSGYRCEALNKAVGGVSNSQHLKGQAADITTGSNQKNIELVKLLFSSGLKVDQCIFEGTWVHISYVKNKNRNQFLKVEKVAGKTVYSKCDLK